MRNKSAQASLWTVFAFGATQILRLSSNLILTRLLLPEMFGLMAIVTVVRVGVYMCSEIGLKVNIIRHPNGEDPEILNTAWTMQVIRGALLWFLIAGIAWFLWYFNGTSLLPLNSVYNDPRLPSLLLVTGATAFITGFESTRVWLAQRNMMLARLTILELTVQFTGLIVMVLCAWAYQSVWALVVGSLVGAFLKTLLSHYVLEGKNNYFFWNKKIVIEFLHFGKWLFLSAVITFFALSGDRVILGGLITAEQLGFYAIAYFIAMALRELIGKLSSNVWYPLLSQIHREEKERIVEVYYGLRQKIDISVYLCVGLIYVVGPLIIEVLYDERYQAAGWMLQILAITLIGSSFQLGTTLLLSMGNPKVGTLAVAIRAIALIVIIPFAYEHYGLEGAVWAIAVNPLFEIPVILWFFAKYRIVSWYKEIRYVPMLIVGYGLGVFTLWLVDRLFSF